MIVPPCCVRLCFGAAASLQDVPAWDILKCHTPRVETLVTPHTLIVRSVQVSDRQLFDTICAGAPKEAASSSGHLSFVADRAEVAVRTCSEVGCTSRVEALSYLGRHFRIILSYIQDEETDEEVGCRCCMQSSNAFPAIYILSWILDTQLRLQNATHVEVCVSHC